MWQDTGVLLGTSGLAERVTRNDKSRNAAHGYSAPPGPSEHVKGMFKTVLLWSEWRYVYIWRQVTLIVTRYVWC
jgi:hypothetical protein